MTRTGIVFLSLLALALAACTGGHDRGATAPTTDAAPPATAVAAVVFTKTGGCGDVFFWATTGDERFAVTAMIDARNRSRAAATFEQLSLPDPDVKVEIVRGKGLARLFCNDVIIPDQMHVDSKVAVSSGSVTVRLDPLGQPGGCGGHGSLHLDGVVSGATGLGPIDVESSQIGCYAG